ncbi:TPR repeat [Rubrobacter radiotolerans]|uniref:TPR repeat n=1 Tax=Rubrobacter radiotolerans TaxID=42256 RepID=A0A023X6B4_RUBRA|nr:hypothetical protein [Rubrobacter radiotolerans]AHY47569.1 TPR repeat [Rubrobacter radiotolerans]MDX5894974.1 hypothetical protein [Rubrobacter radiotolerans]SMC07170.1 lipoprotein NlpI [Rubrobacter radiotolerans DSM 5868]
MISFVLISTLAALALLAGLAFALGRQNRDLLRARAYREFFVRLAPAFSTAVFVAGLPLVLNLTSVDNYGPTLLVYLTGAAVLTVLTARAVAPEERRATRAFRAGDYEKAADLYEELLAYRPLPRYFSALGAARDGSGDPYAALEAADQAIKRDPKLGIAYYNRASALAALGENSRARSDLQTVFEVDSGRKLRDAAGEALDSLERL